MIKKIAYIILVSVSVSACQQNTDNTSQATIIKVDTVKKTGIENLELNDQRLSEIYDSYIQLKNGLVASDTKDAKSAAAAMASLLEGKPDYNKASESAVQISKTGDLKKQRLYFSFLSNELIALIKKSAVKSGTAFVQYCPMANKGEGAYWLSAQKEIKNPYYGSEMLSCGDVKEEITKR